MKQQVHTEITEILRGAAPLLAVEAALPHLLKNGTGAPVAAASSNRRLTRSRHLWTREDGFTMAGAGR